MWTLGSLFAGIGGFELGFERTGQFATSWQVEIDDYATRVLGRHWPRVRRWRDIHSFPPEPASDWHVDVLTGGFPCQDISSAGHRAGLGGPHSGLYYEALRVVARLRPQVVVLENVAALLSRGLGEVLGSLAEIGYDCEWHCIQAASVHAPHRRNRIFIIGSLANADCGRQPAHDQAQQQVGAIHQSLPPPLACAALPRAKEWAAEPALGELVDGVSGRLVRFAGRVTQRDADTARKLKCLGNAVVPQVAEQIAHMVLSRLDGC